MKIILASQSPRRKELLELLLSDFEIQPSDFDERSQAYDGDPGSYCLELAEGKALAVSKKQPEALVIASDTLVFKDGNIYNKPTDRDSARAMIEALQGDSHWVFSSLVMVCPAQDYRLVHLEKVKVTFLPLSHEEIESYLDKEDYAGKAGSYAIQGQAAPFVSEIHGDFYSVVGLPLARLYKELKKLNVPLR